MEKPEPAQITDGGLTAESGARTPRVSVIIAVYNGSRSIPRALASVFAQSFTDYEVVVVDDGSTDDTAAVLAEYQDRIRVIRQPNSGQSTARNAGVLASGGEYLAFLDDDDEWMEQKLTRSVSVLDEDPDCVLVYTRALTFDREGRRIGTLDGQTRSSETPTMKQMLEQPWNVVPSQFVVRRDVFNRCGGFCITGCEDRYFVMQAREHGYFRCIREPLVRKIEHPLYPTWLKREARFARFLSLLHERYGASADVLITRLRSNRADLFKRTARELIKEGRHKDARRCLARVIHYQPASLRNYRKYLRTFIPRGARASSSTDSPGV